MTTTTAQLQNRIAQLSEKFAARCTEDVTALKDLTGVSVAMGPDQQQQIKSIAHRIAGTAALFGFEPLTEPARQLEQAVNDEMTDDHLRQAVHDFMEIIQAHVKG